MADFPVFHAHWDVFVWMSHHFLAHQNFLRAFLKPSNIMRTFVTWTLQSCTHYNLIRLSVRTSMKLRWTSYARVGNMLHAVCARCVNNARACRIYIAHLMYRASACSWHSYSVILFLKKEWKVLLLDNADNSVCCMPFYLSMSIFLQQSYSKSFTLHDRLEPLPFWY